MKKRIVGLLIAIATLIFGAAVFLSACGEEENKEEYSVTVYSPDEKPLPDVTVSWVSGSKTAASAKTDAEGVAKASLSRGTYTVMLSDYYEGYLYTPASVSATQRSIEVELEAIMVQYEVTVTDKDGNPAENVGVTWTRKADLFVAGTAKTNGNGLATHKLAYNEYVVTLAIPSPLSETNIYERPLTVNGNDPFTDFELVEGHNVNYTVTVRSEGGILFKNQSVQVFNGEMLMYSDETNDEGKCEFSLMQGYYTVTATIFYPGTTEPIQGYTAIDGALSPLDLSTEVVLRSKIISSAPASDKRYVMGDIFHDYTFTTAYKIDGKIWSKSVSEILAEKDALIINNWGTGCGNCMAEMGAMQAAYEKYSDKVELVGANNYPSSTGFDSDKTIQGVVERYGYTFPMMRDVNGFAAKFEIGGWPTTIVIDRYGAVARIEVGAITSEAGWIRLIEKYVGEDYKQTFIPGDKTSDSITGEIATPDVELPEDHYEKVAAAMNDTASFPTGAKVEWYGETEYKYAWPFILSDEFADKEPDLDLGSDVYMYSSNTGKASSMSILYAKVTVDVGEVFRFDYYAQTEADDVLSILWDGKIVKQIYGDSKGWKTCYLYVDLTNGEHTLSMTYIKDESGDSGKDNVFFKNFGFAKIANITEPTDMLRCAAYGTPQSGEAGFPYYATVELNNEDGYYYVTRDELENKEYAGNDPKPMLFANLLNVTPWDNKNSLSAWATSKKENSEEYTVDCNFTVNGVTKDYRPVLYKYISAAAASYVPDCVPVNSELKGILTEFMKRVSGNNSHTDEWLEICYFYSHYGDGEPVGNPILGVMEATAIPVKANERITADITRNMYPFPVVIHAFTPETSAVYKFESFIPDKDASIKQAQLWLYDDDTEAAEPLLYSGSNRIMRDAKNEQNFVVYRYLTAGHKYYVALAYLMAETGKYEFTIEPVGQSKTELVPCSYDDYTMILDKDGNITGDISLAGAIEYVKDDDGYYHAKNSDGTVGDFIYLDTKYDSTTALGTIPIYRLVNKNVQDPADFSDLDYKFFDFRYRVVYVPKLLADGTEVTDYTPKVAWTQYGSQYKDYTETVKGWIEEAEKNDGLIKVTQEIVDFLQLYIEMRVNALYIIDGQWETDRVLDNEWLRFCWYNRTYDNNNP